MNEHEQLQESAIDYLRVLAQHIGERPAGSPAEKQAMDYIQEKMEKAGYHIERTPAAFASEWPYFPLFGIGALLLMLAGFLLSVTPIPALLLPLLYIALPQVSRWMIQKKERTKQSENLFASIPDAGQTNRLIVCAHVDSGKMSGLQKPIWINFYNQLLFYGQRIAIFLAMLAIVQMVGVRLPIEIFIAVRVLVLLLGGIWFSLDLVAQLGGSGRCSPGANDNASGVAVAMAFAQSSKVKPPKKYQIAFLFTGAEETGLHGAETFAKKLNPETDVVLNLDMVGIGDQLHYVTAEGTLNILRTDKVLNKVIVQSDKNAKGIWYTVRSGDFAAFLRNGIRATSLEMRSGNQTGYHYHSRFDHIYNIDENALNATLRCLKFFQAFYEDEF
ncbi:MAG: DUF4910 domain-containing protein [Anaerolineaceae bacterium]|nr:DUF4910 domain-containing protein [Anaerolineaceae bacterium]